MSGLVGWYGPPNVLSGAALQAMLVTSSATGDPSPAHHPITCSGPLYYDEDGQLRCDHAAVGPDDLRTQHVIDHTIALLILQCLHQE